MPYDIFGDPQMQQQLVANLFQNALNYGSVGNRIVLELVRQADGIGLVVTDPGPGIPEAARNAAFQPFHRLDPGLRVEIGFPALPRT